MERKIISIDISPESLDEAYKDNGGVMWEHNAVKLVFTIAPEYAGDYRYYIEYRSAIGAKVRTEYLTLDEATSTVSYDIPAAMSSLKCVECLFNIVNIDNDGRTVQVIKPKKFYLEFDYSPDTDNYLCRVNDFSVNALLEAIRNGTFKGETAYGDKEYSPGSLNPQSGIAVSQALGLAGNAVKASVEGTAISVSDVSPLKHPLKISLSSEDLSDYSGASLIVSGKNFYNNLEKEEYKNLNENGESVSSDIMNVSGFIPVAPNNVYNVNFCCNWIFYDENKKFLRANMLYKNSAKRVINVNESATRYIRFSYHREISDGSDIQFEHSVMQSAWTPYSGTKRFYADSEGNIEGALSVSPDMVILPDASGITVNCEYCRDLNKVIDELKNAINELGGNVSV